MYYENRDKWQLTEQPSQKARSKITNTDKVDFAPKLNITHQQKLKSFENNYTQRYKNEIN